jgi:hypothetical protein
MSKSNKKISKEEEKLQQEFFNTTTLFGEEKTSKDFEKLLFQMKLNRVQRIIKRKKKSKNFDVANKEYLEMKSKIGGL